MKFLLFTAFLFSMTAEATDSMRINPFDSFVGSYEVASSSLIHSEGGAMCFRYAFKNLQKLEIKADTDGYHQSHKIYFQTLVNGGDVSYGHAVMNYRDYLPFGGFSYSATSGDINKAVSEEGSETTSSIKKKIISIEKSESNYSLKMREQVIDAEGKLSCFYQVYLRKK